MKIQEEKISAGKPYTLEPLVGQNPQHLMCVTDVVARQLPTADPSILTARTSRHNVWKPTIDDYTG